MKTLLTIMAHKEAQEIFDRHFPYWWDHGHDLFIVYPQQEKVSIPVPRGKHPQQVMSLEVGRKAHTGVESIIRFRTILEQMNGMGYDRYAFLEYDALILGAIPPFEEVAGNVFHDDSPTRGFTGTMFLHPPLLFTKSGLEKVVAQAKKMDLTDEQSVWDRWIGLCLERAGIKPFNLITEGYGTSMNTWHDNDLPRLRNEVLAGRRFIHGIKSKAALEVVHEAHRLWANKQELIREGVIPGEDNTKSK